jgi:stringent starvation protein B
VCLAENKVTSFGKQMNAMASNCKMPVASVLTMAIPQRTAGEGTFFVTIIAYKHVKHARRTQKRATA